MMELPDRYREVINRAPDLDRHGKAKLIQLLEALYGVYAEEPAPLDSTGSVWF